MSSRATRSSAKKNEQAQAASTSESPKQEQKSSLPSPKTRKRAREATDSPTPNKKTKGQKTPDTKELTEDVKSVDDTQDDEDDIPLSRLKLPEDKGKQKAIEYKDPANEPAKSEDFEETGEEFEDPFSQLVTEDSSNDIYDSFTVDRSALPDTCPMLLDEVRDPFLVRRNLYNGVVPVREGSIKTWKTTGDDPTPLMSVNAWQRIMPKNFNLDLLVQCLTFFVSGEYYNPSFADVTEFVVRSIVIYRYNFTRYELHRPKVGIVAGVSVIGVVESKLRASVDTRFISGIMNRGHWERWNGFYATAFNHDNLQGQVVGTKIQFQTKSRFEGGSSESKGGAAFHQTDNPFHDIQDSKYKSPVKQKNSVRRMAPYNYDEDGRI
ncbi:hypothetical protein CC1G_07556 [Coprinopsis cinerea okayama7|uniref:Uncharacterized protein n=1 Tax=Coprinopsis cinerea (strain Okayama-7 / 130 / ATCC MYA-4618 / FGSC 9003) TaxID=240176 RepID=A8NUK1_COPC7|nr:hypothetical protein CC1G_07556 [Coprinopsis cinerea okayama7\|eukprot:XP_001836473.1 hypothetical protein CC1G_07556 [Coprinopsis cinerea okayama7\